MADTKRIFRHDGDEKTPLFAILGYTFGTNRVERWTYLLLDADQNPVGTESEKYNDGKKAILCAQIAVNADNSEEI